MEFFGVVRVGDGAGEAGVGGFEVVGLLYAGSGAVAFGDGYPGAHGGPEGAGADVDLVGVAFGVVGVVAVESGGKGYGSVKGYIQRYAPDIPQMGPITSLNGVQLQYLVMILVWHSSIHDAKL